MYSAYKHNGCIYSIASGSSISGAAISEDEYNRILAAIKNKPTAPEGFDYRLRQDLAWELYELPEMEEIPEEATEGDYIAALAELGVSL